MSSSPIALLERKKEPFLKAFIRSGKVAPATRAVRISRDAVYDWLRADPVFRRAFEKAKRLRYDYETASLSDALDFLLTAVRPIIPQELYPRVVAAANLTLSKRRFNVGQTSTVRSASRKGRFSSFDVIPESANSGYNDENRVAQGKNGPIT